MLEPVNELIEATLSERRPDLISLEAAIKALPECVFITDCKGHITYVNSGFTEQTGFESVEAVGTTPRILSSGMMPDGFMAQLWETVLAGKKWRGRILNRRLCHTSFENADEHEVLTRGLYWVDVSITPVFDEHDQLQGFVTIQRDITEEVEREAEASFTKEAVQLKADAGSALQSLGPLTERFTQVLELLASIQGGDEAKACGVLLCDSAGDPESSFVQLGESCGHDLPFDHAASTGGLVVLDECEAEGSRCEHGHYLVPMMQGGKCLGVIDLQMAPLPNRSAARLAMFKHVGELMAMALMAERAREQLELAKRHADEVARAKANFLANMSHEIRTPMYGVIGMTQLLQGTSLDEEQEHFARTIENSADALLVLINDILDYSRIEAGDLSISKEAVDLPLLIEEVGALIAFAAESRGITLVLDVDPSLSQKVICDPARLRQLLNNLVSNAVKFTLNGDVTIRLRLKGEQLRCEVSDTGIGIAPERFDTLFQGLTQASGADARQLVGTGLGLPICKQIVALLDGEIGFESQLGLGSTFWFEFPVELKSKPQADAKLSGTRVLVVESHAARRAWCEQILGYWGCDVTAVEHVDAAVLTLEKSPQAAWSMALIADDPELGGAREIAKRLTASSHWNAAPMAAITSAQTRAARDKLLVHGTAEVLLAPVGRVQLRRAISRLIGSSRAESGVASQGYEAPKLGMHVLVADDNKVNRAIAEKMLQRLGCTCELAVNGQEAMRLALRGRFDMVLMDVHMPVMDGHQATCKIRAVLGPELPIIAMTAMVTDQDREACFNAGMTEHIGKPVRLEDLGALLEAYGSAT